MGGIGFQLVRWGRPVVTICSAGRWQCAIQVVPDPEREEAEGMVDLEPAEPADPDGNGWLVPSWVASVRTTAHRLGGELQRTGPHEPLADAASQQAVKKAIERALTRAQRPGLACSGPFKLLRFWALCSPFWPSSPGRTRTSARYLRPRGPIRAVGTYSSLS